MEAWASGAGLGAEQLEDLQLVLGEAVADSVEHAYSGRTTGEVRYRAGRRSDDGLSVEVGDDGRWRLPGDPGFRGRGLHVIGHLADDLAVDHDATGTRLRFTLPAAHEVPSDPVRPALRTRPDRARDIELTVHDDAGQLHLRLVGALDLLAVPVVRPDLVDRISASTGPVVLDLRGVGYLASAGIGLLLEAADLARGGLRLVWDPTGPVARVLRLTGLDQHVARQEAWPPAPGPLTLGPVPGLDPLVDPVRLTALDAVLPLARHERRAMDRLAELAATVMDAPVGMVNLLSGSEQHVVGLFGVPGEVRRDVPLAAGYCASTLRSGAPLYLDDAAADPSFRDHPAFRELGFVAYAGAPLRDVDGMLLGTLCVTDTRTRRWRRLDQRALEALAESVVSEIALHREADRRQRLLDAFDLAPAAIAVTRGPDHVLDYTNAALRALLGPAPLGKTARDGVPLLPAANLAAMDRVLRTGVTRSGTDSPMTVTWPGESTPRERFFDYSYSPIDGGPVDGGPVDGGPVDEGPSGLLAVAVEVTDRVRAGQALDRRARHQELLARASAALTRDLDPAAELQELAAAVVPELADLSTVHVLARPAVPGTDPPLPVRTDRVAVAVAPGRLPLPPTGVGLIWDGHGDPITATIRAGTMLRRPIPTPEVPEWAATTGTSRTFSGGLDHVVLAPVIVEGLVVAVVAFGLRGDRPLWADDELDVLAEIARRAGIALGHGLTYQRTRTSALTLQRSLLTAPPRVPGLDIAARYRPAGRDEVGGDWHDTFLRDPGRLVLVVGDVVGHDMTAAAAMAQLRATLRTIALDREDGPAAALDRLDAVNARLGITPFATLVHAHLTRSGTGWRLCWASAGHPPPVLLAPGEPPRLLTEALGAALTGMVAEPRGQSELMLAPGSTLLLYTDGLVERAGTDLDEMIAAVATRAAGLADAPVDELCDVLLRHAPDTDDIALLAVRVPPEG